MDWLEKLTVSFVERWYVWTFFVSYVVVAWWRWRLKATGLYLALGYLIAMASEALSIRTGIPYGWYFYHYPELQNDPLVLGVPFWDSLSYVFLTFAAYLTAQFLLLRTLRFQTLPATENLRAKVRLTAAFLTMLLDIVIDPVAAQGHRWFLGHIYDYPMPGFHFGVPLANYFGWFLVAWLIVVVFDAACTRLKITSAAILDHPANLLGVGLYAGIIAFNLAIAAWIGEKTLLISSIFVVLPLFWILMLGWSRGKS